MSMESLRKALENKKTDTFDIGTVIRWIAAGKYRYAAIKTEIGWVTTSRYDNGHVPATTEFDGLVKILNRSETSQIEVSTAWESVEQ